MPSSLKRRAASPSLSDSENVDPSQKGSAKRKRGLDGDADDIFKPSKAPINQITLTTKARSSITSIQSPRTETPKLTTNFTTSITPSSAPAAAGRSPTSSKRVGLLSRSRRGLSRMDPPAFGAKSRTSTPMLSLSTALSGTMTHARPSHKPAKHIPTLEESIPKSWQFQIHEDTPEEEMVNLMGHSTCVLDISDDESKGKSADDRGKENVPPMDLLASITTAALPISRRDAMSDESRIPLGDLKPSDFYADGCDETSFITVPDDETTAAVKPITSSIDNILAGSSSTEKSDFTLDYPSSSSALLRTTELDALIYGNKPQIEEEDIATDIEGNDEDAVTDIEIWESGSAKEEELNNTAEIVQSIFAV
ncbi:hypothetical protein UCRPC4_g02805 [Phaeomoniella chlamydospora]|uniref:Thymidylate kinase n=1 Tax=Phaeomoniella chlamydospora TaxID=158046 RepID=A0A0G2ELQ5_PHACM|nr:hypothetical protein UCRPC4_g02805 [Phaeomoniella chlamydospora]